MLTDKRIEEIIEEFAHHTRISPDYINVVAAIKQAIKEAHANATPLDFTTAECAQVLIDMAIQRGEVVTIRLVSDYPPRMGAYLMVPEVRKVVKKD